MTANIHTFETRGAIRIATNVYARLLAAGFALVELTATMGGLPSYVQLITCLEMKRDARKLPDNTTSGQSINR